MRLDASFDELTAMVAPAQRQQAARDCQYIDRLVRRRMRTHSAAHDRGLCAQVYGTGDRFVMAFALLRMGTLLCALAAARRILRCATRRVPEQPLAAVKGRTSKVQ
jgi:hypothetical protein